MNKLEKVAKAGLELADKTKQVSTPIIKASADAKLKKPVAEDEEILKEWYKSNYDRDWSFSAAFRPTPKDGLKYDAWRDWYVEKYGVEPEE